MKLLEYVDANGMAAICSAIGAHGPDMSRWARGLRQVPEWRCPDIERATAATVTCEELRSDVVWHRVPDPAWPHPEGRPLIDVAAPKEGEHAAA